MAQLVRRIYRSPFQQHRVAGIWQDHQLVARLCLLQVGVLAGDNA